MIGVLALQGAFREHMRALDQLGARTRAVRLPEDLEGLDGLVVPGGESTTMSNLMERMGLVEVLRGAVSGGLPTLATCAGMILLARDVSDGMHGQEGLGILDIEVQRNGYGRQLESFEAGVQVAGVDQHFPGVFIRAPRIQETGATEVIATYGGEPVGVRQGNVMAFTFHPELSGDLRLHGEFLRIVASPGERG